MDKGVYRIIDANLNRVMEGLRVSEDIIRFSPNNEELTRSLKDLHNTLFPYTTLFRSRCRQEVLGF